MVGYKRIRRMRWLSNTLVIAALTFSPCCPYLLFGLQTCAMAFRSPSEPSRRSYQGVFPVPHVLLLNRGPVLFSQMGEESNESQNTALSILETAEVDSMRAGADGYSVMRQPVSKTNWNPEADPDFDVPATLSEAEDGPRKLDDDWWSQRQAKPYAQHLGKRKLDDSTDSEADSLQDLDLFQRSYDTLDYPRVLKALRDECSTVPARNFVKAAQTTSTFEPQKSKRRNVPMHATCAYQSVAAEDVLGCQERYRAVREMEWILEGGRGDVDLDGCFYRNRKGYKEDLAGRPPPFAGNSFALQEILEMADQGKVLEGPEIFEVSSSLDTLENVVLWGQGLEKVKDLDFVEIPKMVGCIEVNATLQDLLHNAFDQDGRLSGATFPTIGRLRARVRSLKSDILSTLEGLLALPSMRNKLALESGGSLISEVNGGRLVVPLAQKYASAVGIVHDTSRSGKTVYVEPTEIVGSTNELRQVEGELRAEEGRVWRLLTEQILKNKVLLETAINAIGQLDLVLARLMLGRKIGGTIPEVRDEGVIQLRNAKHPVLLLRKIDHVVGSDIDLGQNGNQGIVLTGPNSGGKTVILKLLGLSALMARSGIPIPADGSIQRDSNEDGDSDSVDYVPRVDFFNPVLADIGDIQSVGGDLSTFSGHMLVCREVLANSGKNALVLMDELGSGTDPAQGVAIAQSILEALVETGARVGITTHYMQLKQLAASDDRFSVAGMQFVGGRPTYKLLPGTVGESFALAVAERLELPQSVIDRATDLLDSETRQMGDLLRELEDQKARVDEQVAELEESRKEMAAMKFKMQEEQLKLEKKMLNARRDEAKKFAQKLEEKERVMEDILEKLKADPSRRIVAKSWDDIKFIKRDAINEAENIPSVIARKQKKSSEAAIAEAELVPIAEMREKPELNEGDRVLVCKSGPLFGREATIIKALGGRVEVRVNNMNVGLKLSQIALPPKTGTVKSKQQSTSGRPKSMSSATEKLIASEANNQSSQSNTAVTEKKDVVTMRTQSNTVDVRGCNLEAAKEMSKDKFSTCLINGRSVVYILHGHGSGGVLKSKIRNWLKSEKTLVKKWSAADVSDGGDAFTRVELR